MRNSITDVPGITVGNAQNMDAARGCTVVLCPQGATPGVDVRGGAPGTREIDCCQPANFVPFAHAVYLGGGSAFGLEGAGGVMRFLEEKKAGLDVGVTKVPIVPGAVIFDLLLGDPGIRPDAAMGYSACAAAGLLFNEGNAGAGTGASVGKTAGVSRSMKGGLGTSSVQAGALIVGALVIVNCFGDVIEPGTGETIAGALNEAGDGFAGSMTLLAAHPEGIDPFRGNTTIGVVATNARLSKAQANRVAMMAHDGFARAINPVHTMHDGDTIFCLATGSVEADVTVVGSLAAEAMARAIVSAVMHADSAYGLPGFQEMRARMKKGASSGALPFEP